MTGRRSGRSIGSANYRGINAQSRCVRLCVLHGASWLSASHRGTARENVMTICHLILTAAAALTLVTSAQSAEIKVLSSNAVKTVLEQLGPQFETTSGHRIAVTWGTAA